MLAPYVFARSMFDEVFDSAFADRRPSTGTMMRTDIKESDAGYELIVDLPGVNREDLNAELKDGYLIVTASVGQKKDGEAEATGKYLRRERIVGSFQRSFYVGKRVKQEDIRARFDNGVLQLFVPKVTAPPAEEKQYIRIED